MQSIQNYHCWCMVWSPQTLNDINLLEAVQRPAAHWFCNSRWDSETFTWSVSNDASFVYRQFVLSRISITLTFPTYCTDNTMRTHNHVLTCLPLSMPPLEGILFFLFMFVLSGMQYQFTFWN